jgi:hypothetical protein
VNRTRRILGVARCRKASSTNYKLGRKTPVSIRVYFAIRDPPRRWARHAAVRLATRRRSGTWHVYYGNARVGTIGKRAGVPINVNQWGWSCDFHKTLFYTGALMIPLL